jgi:putative transposase
MKQKRYTEEQIAYAFRQAEGGVPVMEFCRKLGIADDLPPFFGPVIMLVA